MLLFDVCNHLHFSALSSFFLEDLLLSTLNLCKSEKGIVYFSHKSSLLKVFSSAFEIYVQCGQITYELFTLLHFVSYLPHLFWCYISTLFLPKSCWFEVAAQIQYSTLQSITIRFFFMFTAITRAITMVISKGTNYYLVEDIWAASRTDFN